MPNYSILKVHKPKLIHSKAHLPLCCKMAGWGFNLPQPKKSAPTKQIPESKKIRRHLKEIASGLSKSGNFIKSYYSPSIVAEDLSKAISQANKLLSELAATPSKRTVELFFFNSLESVVELEKLSFREDIFPLLRDVARKQTMSLVVYPQNRAEQLKLKENMERLGLGTQAYRKIGSPSRKHTSGKYADRIGLLLWEVHFDGNLRQSLSRHAVMKSATVQDRELAAKRNVKNLVVQTPDVNSPQQWENRLVSQGWPSW